MVTLVPGTPPQEIRVPHVPGFLAEGSCDPTHEGLEHFRCSEEWAREGRPAIAGADN